MDEPKKFPCVAIAIQEVVNGFTVTVTLYKSQDLMVVEVLADESVGSIEEGKVLGKRLAEARGVGGDAIHVRVSVRDPGGRVPGKGSRH